MRLVTYDVTILTQLIFCVFIILMRLHQETFYWSFACFNMYIQNELFKITFSQEKQSSACSIVYSFRCLDTFDIILLRLTEVILGVSPYTNIGFISK